MTSDMLSDMAPTARKSILFVCLGNICRSPMAEGLFRSIAEMRGISARFHLDSAGLGDWHAGKPPSHNAVEVCRENGLDIATLRARHITRDDFRRFDLILAMDDENVADLRALAPTDGTAEVAQFHEFATGEARPVPDPYYGDYSDYVSAYRLIRTASEALAAKFETELLADKG